MISIKIMLINKISLIFVTVFSVFRELHYFLQAELKKNLKNTSKDESLSLSDTDDKKLEVKEIKYRHKLISRATLNIGLKIGRYQYNGVLSEYLDNIKVRKSMDAAFPMHKFVFKTNFLPPIIDYKENTLTTNQAKQRLRKTKFIFTKILPARTVLANPTWQSYFLLVGSDRPEYKSLINQANSPISTQEFDLWLTFITKGYASGVNFARHNFEASLNRLNRDFEGYLLFYILQDQGLITPVKLNKELNKDYVVSKDELRIGDEIYAILEPSFSVKKYLEKLLKLKNATTGAKKY